MQVYFTVLLRSFRFWEFCLLVLIVNEKKCKALCYDWFLCGLWVFVYMFEVMLLHTYIYFNCTIITYLLYLNHLIFHCDISLVILVLILDICIICLYKLFYFQYFCVLNTWVVSCKKGTFSFLFILLIFVFK